MSSTQIIAQNTVWQIIGKIVSAGASGVSLMLLTRYLSQEHFGFYGTALSLTQFAAIIADLGLYLVCLKEISSNSENEQKIFNHFWGLRLTTSFIIFLLATVIIFFLPYDPLVKQASIFFAGGFIFSSLVQLITALFQKRMTMGVVATSDSVSRLLMLGLIYLLLSNNIQLPWIAATSLIASLVGFVWLFLVANAKQKIFPQYDKIIWKNIIKQTWPITLGVLLNLVYFRADSIIISLTQPASDVAIYTAPYKLLEIIATFPHMFMGLIMPLTTYAWVNNNYLRLNRLIQRTSEFFLIITVPLLAASYISGEKIMALVAGTTYNVSGTILFPLMIATGAIFAGTAFTYLIVTIEKQKTMLPFYGAAAIIALILYGWLIPIYSYTAAAWITAVVEVFIGLSAFVICKKTVGLNLRLQPMLKIISAGLIMVVILLLTNNLNLILQLLISGIAYLLMLFVIKSLTVNDVKSFLKLKSST